MDIRIGNVSGRAMVAVAVGIAVAVLPMGAGIGAARSRRGDPPTPAPSVPALPKRLPANPDVRVCFDPPAGGHTLAVLGPFRIRGPRGSVLMDEDSLGASPVRLEGDFLAVGDRRFSAKRVDIIPEDDGTIQLNGVCYPGTLALLIGPEKNFCAVNTVPLERYLECVIGGEMPLRWPPAALEAQAVAARTYALYQVITKTDLPWVMGAGEDSQMYTGLKGESPVSRRVVKDTQGKVLLYRAAPIPAYYHSSCAGHTENAAVVFGGESLPPLSGVPCAWCFPPKEWELELEKKELSRMLRDARVPVKGVRGVEAETGRNGIHRESFRIDAPDGPVTLAGEIFRKIIGPRRLRSTNCIVTDQGDRILFQGKGWGHGVGMCQWGAFGMASRKYTGEEILMYYYPGADIEKIY
ncbi:MAG: SpoIID/LytB domain-containing protein [Planctomycetota bacterium]